MIAPIILDLCGSLEGIYINLTRRANSLLGDVCWCDRQDLLRYGVFEAFVQRLELKLVEPCVALKHQLHILVNVLSSQALLRAALAQFDLIVLVAQDVHNESLVAVDCLKLFVIELFSSLFDLDETFLKHSVHATDVVERVHVVKPSTESIPKGTWQVEIEASLDQEGPAHQVTQELVLDEIDGLLTLLIQLVAISLDVKIVTIVCGWLQKGQHMRHQFVAHI